MNEHTFPLPEAEVHKLESFENEASGDSLSKRRFRKRVSRQRGILLGSLAFAGILWWLRRKQMQRVTHL